MPSIEKSIPWEYREARGEHYKVKNLFVNAYAHFRENSYRAKLCYDCLVGGKFVHAKAYREKYRRAGIMNCLSLQRKLHFSEVFFSKKLRKEKKSKTQTFDKYHVMSKSLLEPIFKLGFLETQSLLKNHWRRIFHKVFASEYRKINDIHITKTVWENLNEIFSVYGMGTANERIRIH